MNEWWGNVLPEAKGVGLQLVRRESGEGTYVEPEYNVTIGWVTRAPGKLFVAGGVDDDGVLEGAYCFIVGALAFAYWYVIRFPRAMQRKTTKILNAGASGVSSASSPFLNTPNSARSLLALFLSLFLISTLATPSPSSSPPFSTSYKESTTRRPHTLSKFSTHTRTE